MTKVTTHSNVKHVGPPHSAPGAIDHQLVYFSYLFGEAPDPQVQHRNLASVSSGHVAGIGCNLNKPTSSDTITITSCNPNDLPVVVPNYLHASLDRRSARELVHTGYGVISSPAMQSVLESPIDLTDSIFN